MIYADLKEMVIVVVLAMVKQTAEEDISISLVASKQTDAVTIGVLVQVAQGHGDKSNCKKRIEGELVKVMH